MAYEPGWFLNVFDWLVLEPPLKKKSSSVGMMTFPIYDGEKNVFETTKQLMISMVWTNFLA